MKYNKANIWWWGEPDTENCSQKQWLMETKNSFLKTIDM